MSGGHSAVTVEHQLVHVDGFGTKAPIRTTRLEPLYDHWAALCRGRRMPSRKDLDLLTLPRATLPHLVLWDVVRGRGAVDLSVRLAGTAVEQLFGRSLKGCRLDDLFPPEEARRTYASTLEVLVRREPRCGRYVRYQDGAEILVSAGLVLPLSSDGETVDALLACIAAAIDLRLLDDVLEAAALFTTPAA